MFSLLSDTKGRSTHLIVSICTQRVGRKVDDLISLQSVSVARNFIYGNGLLNGVRETGRFYGIFSLTRSYSLLSLTTIEEGIGVSNQPRENSREVD